MKKTKIAPVRCWGIYCPLDGELYLDVHSSREEASARAFSDERVIRVEIRPVRAKPRRKAKKAKP